MDTLNYTRRLSELHIGVIFMNDGIDTREKDGKLRLTIMSSIAQEESRKISERVKWSMKRNMENGVVLGCGRIYRYKIKEGKLEVVPEEAEIVKQIFSWYLYDGMGSHSIARNLDEQGIPTLKNHVWSPQHVLKILKNDKYAGDLTQWKVYKPNVLSEKVLVNHGDNSDAPLITIHNHHEPLISKEMWDEVQNELYRRSFLSREGRKHSKSYWFSGKMRCGKCDYSYIVASSTSNPFRSLGCRNRQIHGKQRRMGLNGEWFGCDNHMVDERILDKVMEHIMNEMKLMLPVLETEIVQDLQMLQAPESEADVSKKNERR